MLCFFKFSSKLGLGDEKRINHLLIRPSSSKTTRPLGVNPHLAKHLGRSLYLCVCSSTSLHKLFFSRSQDDHCRSDQQASQHTETATANTDFMNLKVDRVHFRENETHEVVSQ